jgi:hypothetical protein
MKERKPKTGLGLESALRGRVDRARDALLHLHKALLDHERAGYERAHRPVAGSGALLQLVIHNPAFAWLRPVSELIVQMDELLAADEGAAAPDAEALLAQARSLVRADEQGEPFHRQYHRALQESPGIVMAHAAWKRAAGDDRRTG